LARCWPCRPPENSSDVIKARSANWIVISPPGVANSPPDRLLFEIERTINGQSAERRKAVRQELSAPLVADLQVWMRAERGIANRLILSPAAPGTMFGRRC